ncbi:hypothetical protein EGR_09756 [Echinococcus granulosus]|uniref:Uncharacterized protein n=1 Tax=Echinococcus granulosus TaxID=6210 RepID=W6UPQ3_ECHGR|nr:hypothetical protein EGR_09756 [Echinococcus granulosus]EUB55379.1 hypothetical protein EGR_09756 [Echinococcus granulosus]
MNCLDPAEIPTIQPFDVDTFEDKDHLGNKVDASAVQICGFHPKEVTGFEILKEKNDLQLLQAATPVSVEEQELAWEQCSAVYNVILAAIIGTVIVVHFAFLLHALWGAIKRACIKQTHLRTHGADEVGEDEVPLTYTPNYVWYAGDGKIPLKGLAQEDFIDFERYAHFVYAQSHEP